ncbi:MAG TPA: CatB-related O-acetyltransferase, partial [Desulfarculaceae bacterium]|nr:CatB-related O-acetyltransferase [Desulfarculaceae bacterium]
LILYLVKHGLVTDYSEEDTSLIKKFLKKKKQSLFTADLIDKENIEIGDYTYGKPHIYRWSKEYRVSIGRFCSIADDVHLLVDGNHRSDWISTYPFGRLLEGFSKNCNHPIGKGNIRIGNDVWIARGAVILSGISIGNGAVIAAGTMVVKNVADYEVVGGNPGTNLSFRFSKTQIDALLKIAWWDWPLTKIASEINFLESDNIDRFIERNLP